MSESANESVETIEPQKQGDPADAPLGDNGKKALSAEREARKAAEKERDDFKRKLDEIASANLSDLERAQKEAADARQAAERASAEALRLRVAAKHGITDEDADLFLTGSDLDTLERQAARLSERAPAATAPRADLTQGGKDKEALALNGDPLLNDLKSKLGIR